LGPPPCQPRWPASPCTCNGLWLHSCMAVVSKRTMCFLLRIKLHALIRLGVSQTRILGTMLWF
jgi:hypothetical protein